METTNAAVPAVCAIILKPMRCFSLLLVCWLAGSCALAQSPQDIAIPVQVAAGINPAAVLLSWPNPTPADLILRRRIKGQAGNTWTELLNAPATTQNGYFDTGVTDTEVYEYEVERKTGSITAYGAAFASFFTPVVDSRGKILVFIDSTTADALGTDLLLYKNDLRGEGWQTVPIKTGGSTTVQWVKNQIVSAYTADPNNIKAVLLIGAVPVPYSGNTAWDHQPDHVGAWPCDAYYGDIDGTWTDNTVNNTTAARAANRNIPGDGKFDQSTLPSAVELPVGRLDFRHLSAATFGAPPVELLRQYLLKNHRWRNGQYPVPDRALVDDHLGWSGGEAFAADGYRNAYPLVGENQVVTGDFLAQNTAARYLMGYGAASAGTYSNATGIGTASNFATDSARVVFASLYGDYFGDWDAETNPLMPAALASKGGLLACVWAGRPHWQLQGLAAGAPIGYCLTTTQNAQYDAAYGASEGESGAHIALLGDPTLRAQVVAPPTNLSVVSNCNKMNLHWTASRDSGVLGYLVYRAFDLNGPYTRVTTNLVTATAWADLNPVADTLFYAVRAVKLETTPGGGSFYNTSTSDIKFAVFAPGTAPTVLGLGGNLNCNTTSLTLGANFQPFTCTYQWYRPNGTAMSGYTATAGGIYTVVVTAPNGCTSMAFATVNMDTSLPVISFPGLVQLNCNAPTASFTVPSAASDIQYTFNDQPVQPGEALALTTSGVFKVASTTNGCSDTYPVVVQQDFNPPGATAGSDGNNLDCNHGSVQLFGSSGTNGVAYNWTSGLFSSAQQNPIVTQAGTYCLTTTATNGCTSSSCVTVNAVGGAVSLEILSSAPNCNDGSAITLVGAATGGIAPYDYAWSNGNIGSQITLNPGFSGTIGLIATDSNNCVGNASITITAQLSMFALTNNPSTPDAADGSIELLLFGGLPPYQFVWSSGNTTQNISGLPSGVYTVTVTGSNDCSATLTIPLITVVGTDVAISQAPIRIAPNPARTQIGVYFEQGATSATIRLLDISGRTVATQTGEKAIFMFETEVLPRGMYWVEIVTAGNRVYKKVILL